MKTLVEHIDKVFVGIATGGTFLFGTFDLPIQILLVLIVTDYITGITKGYITKQLNSSTGANGLIKKAMTFVVLIVAVLADRLLGTEFIIRVAVCYFYVFNESISILENLGEIGVPIPKKLMDALSKIKDLGGDVYKKDSTNEDTKSE